MQRRHAGLEFADFQAALRESVEPSDSAAQRKGVVRLEARALGDGARASHRPVPGVGQREAFRERVGGVVAEHLWATIE